MEMEKRKPHDCECLYIARTQNTGVVESDYVMITLVKAPYQPVQVNRVRLALMHEEDEHGHITFDMVDTLIREHIKWTHADCDCCSLWTVLPTPEGMSEYIREWVFSDTREDRMDYIATKQLY